MPHSPHHSPHHTTHHTTHSPPHLAHTRARVPPPQVFASAAQQHMFNMPYQLSHPSIIESPDDPDCADVTVLETKPVGQEEGEGEGDILYGLDKW
jgi:hypothetical protein